MGGDVTRVFRYDSPFHDLDDESKGHFLKWTPTPSQLIAKQVAEMIASDHEGKIRQALIDLGWTPPPDKEPKA